MTALVAGTWIDVVGVLGLISLVPVVWAIVDVARRPAWQFSTGRKVMWAVTLGIGWLLLWPLALVSSIVYLSVLRRRFPPAAAEPRNPMAGHHYGSHRPYGPYGPYGGGTFGPGTYGQAGSGPSGPGPYSQGPFGQQGQPGPFAPGADPYGHRPPPASLPPAGWYPDPAGSPQERWWDGRGWTDHLRSRPPAAS